MKSFIHKVIIFNMSDFKTALAEMRHSGGGSHKNRSAKPFLLLVLLVAAVTLMNLSCINSKKETLEGIVTPVNLARVAMATESADIEWTINYDSDFSHYAVYRGKKPNVAINSEYKLVFKTYEKYQVRFTDWGLEPGTKYYYKVFTFNESDKYAMSNEVMGETSLTTSVFWNGEITKDTYWSLGMSPIVVKGDVTVAKNAKLTIDKGVTVRFSVNDLQVGGGFAQKTELIVKGTLYAVGDSLSPITFMSNERYNSPGDWGGLRFDNATGGSNNILRYCKIMHATSGVTAINTSCTLDNLQISHCLNYGIATTGSAAAIRFCQINDVGQGQGEAAGISMGTPPNPHVYNCVISFVNNYGIFVESGVSVIDHNVVAECGVAGISCPPETLDLVTNNAVVNNFAGVKNAGSSTDSKPDYNNVYHDSNYPLYANYSNCSGGAHSQSANPRFVLPDYKNPDYGDFSLDTSSTMLRAGQSGTDIGLQNPLRYGIK